MKYVLAHTKLWWCWWDLLALIVLVAIIVYFIVRNRKMKEIQKDYEDRLSDLYAGDSMEQDTASK